MLYPDFNDNLIYILIINLINILIVKWDKTGNDLERGHKLSTLFRGKLMRKRLIYQVMKHIHNV